MALSKRNLAFAGSLYVALVLLFFVFDRIESSLYGLKYQVKVAGDLQSEGISRQPDLDCLRLPSPPPNHLDVNWTGVWVYTGNPVVCDSRRRRRSRRTLDRRKSCGHAGYEERKGDRDPFHSVEPGFSSGRNAIFANRRRDVPDDANGSFPFHHGSPEPAGALSGTAIDASSIDRSNRFLPESAFAVLGHRSSVAMPDSFPFVADSWNFRSGIHTARSDSHRADRGSGFDHPVWRVASFEALTIKHGEVTNPAFVAALQNHAESLHVLHPDTLHWTEGSNPYDKGDPIDYCAWPAQ